MNNSASAYAPQRSRRPTVVMMGHFPPPVHGMAVAFEYLAAAFEHDAEVVRLTTSSHRLGPSITYHIVRLFRLALALVRLVRLRFLSRRLILSVDAGLGMVYVIIAVLFARLLRYRLYLQHHSYGYLDRRTNLMRLLALCSGGCEHLCSCSNMGESMQIMYPSIRNILIVPVSYAVNVPAHETDRSTPASVSRPRVMRIGHFGNITMAKGLEAAVETIHAAIEQGIPAKLILAGPLGGSAEKRLVENAIRAHPGHISYLGPVYGSERDQLLRGLDLLLFPSRYSHESFGLAVWESLGLGTPVIAYRAGCLTQEATGPGAMVLDPSENFVDLAVDRIRLLHEDQTALDSMSRAARDGARLMIRIGRDALANLTAQML